MRKIASKKRPHREKHKFTQQIRRFLPTLPGSLPFLLQCCERMRRRLEWPETESETSHVVVILTNTVYLVVKKNPLTMVGFIIYES